MDLNSKNHYQMSPLHCAAAGGKPNTVEALINLGARTEQVDSAGLTALHYAAGMGSKETVERLITMGAHINLRTKVGWNPIGLAAQEDHWDIVDLLLQQPHLDRDLCTQGLPDHIREALEHRKTTVATPPQQRL